MALDLALGLGFSKEVRSTAVAGSRQGLGGWAGPGPRSSGAGCASLDTGSVWPLKESLLRARAHRASKGRRGYVSGSLLVTKETPGQMGLKGTVSVVVSALGSEPQL